MWKEIEQQDLETLLREHPVWKNFGLISKIPRPSFGEKALSDWLLAWSKDLGLEAVQDRWNNLLIRKPATPGKEACPAVMIQAHLDMVCQKAPGIIHDFDKDPIPLELEGDLISTGGKTTLGADDGIGIALAMAMLEAKDLAHPELEVLLTSAEEEDLSGALNVDASGFNARLLINIDNTVESQLVAGSCGGMGVELSLPAAEEPVEKELSAWRIELTGLPGGHSGGDIHRGLGNANVLLGRLLLDLQGHFPLRIQTIQGGSFRLAIPREASAEILTAPAQEALLRERLRYWEGIFQVEYEALPGTLRIGLTPATASATAPSQAASAALITSIILAPNGINEMNSALPGIVESSANLGEIFLLEERFRLIFEVRAAFDSTARFLESKLECLARQTGGSLRSFAHYPGWQYKLDSPLRDLVTALYQQEFQEPMETLVVHSGLECGCLTAKLPGLDAISIGPDTWGLHSPAERISVRSTERVYHLLRKVLAEIS